MYCFKSPLFYFVVWQGNYGHELQITVLPQHAHYAEGIYAFLFASSFFYTYKRNIIIVSLSSDIFIVMAWLQYFLGCLGTKFTALVYHKIGCRWCSAYQFSVLFAYSVLFACTVNEYALWKVTLFHARTFLEELKRPLQPWLKLFSCFKKMLLPATLTSLEWFLTLYPRCHTWICDCIPAIWYTLIFQGP